MSPITPPGETRERVFEYVRERLLEGFPPTVREVQKAFKFKAVQTAQAHLQQLVAEGRLVKQRGKARGFSLPSGQLPAVPTTFVPLLGRVQAGSLNAAIEDCDGYIPVETRTPSETGLFALRVHGESMVGAGIHPGDIAIVRAQPTARSGEVVVALVGDEATVKTLRIQRGKIVLQPENPDFEPIVPDPDEVTILGKVIETRRKFD